MNYNGISVTDGMDDDDDGENMTVMCEDEKQKPKTLIN